MSNDIYTHGAIEAWDAWLRGAASERYIQAWNSLIHSYHSWKL